jgi:hypothetical protein
VGRAPESGRQLLDSPSYGRVLPLSSQFMRPGLPLDARIFIRDCLTESSMPVRRGAISASFTLFDFLHLEVALQIGLTPYLEPTHLSWLETGGGSLSGIVRGTGPEDTPRSPQTDVGGSLFATTGCCQAVDTVGSPESGSPAPERLLAGEPVSGC